MSTYSFEKTLSKGTQFSLDETPIENGKVRVTTDTKRLFFDLDDERFEITDFISDYSESYILNNIDNPMPKIYLSNDTFKLFKWNKITNSWDNICDNVGHADYAFKALQDENGNSITRTYAPKASPAFTGNPTAPKASGTDINSITNVDYVTNYVSDQLASLKNGMIVIVTSYSDLPTVGESGKIYLVPSSSGSGKNRYDEYIWSTTLNDYEKFGTTDIDLDGYFNSINVSGSGNAITDISIDSTNTSKLNINKGTSFLTEHPSINRTTSSREEAPTYGTKFDVVESLTMDQNGHITGYNTKKVEMVENVNHANTADSARTANYATDAMHAVRDAQDNIISEYINNITTNGSTVVFKKGDNTDINFVVPYAETSGSSQGEVTWDAVTNKPTVFPPSSHNHTTAEITDFGSHNHTTADITNFADAVQGIKVDNASIADYASKANLAIDARYASKARNDDNDNPIDETYETKDEHLMDCGVFSTGSLYAVKNNNPTDQFTLNAVSYETGFNERSAFPYFSLDNKVCAEILDMRIYIVNENLRGSSGIFKLKESVILKSPTVNPVTSFTAIMQKEVNIEYTSAGQIQNTLYLRFYFSSSYNVWMITGIAAESGSAPALNNMKVNIHNVKYIYYYAAS